MKKVLLVAFLIVMVILLNNNFSKEEIVIPNESIRIRVIGNSDAKNDQKIKRSVKKSIQKQLSNMLKGAENIEDVRKVLKDNLGNIEYTVSKELESNNTTQDFNVQYGYNYFPKKKYKGINYKEGYYESIVIKLGKSKGENWWCVLFPPLCLMDEESDMEEVEYKSFVKEIVDKYF